MVYEGADIHGSLKVLFCTLDYFPEVAGGAEHQARLQAEALVELGHDVTVVCPGLRRSRDERIAGVKVRRLPFIDHRPLRKLSYYLRLAPFLLRHAGRFDIVHVHLANAQADLIVLLCRVAGTPVYVKCACGGSAGEVARGNRHFAKVTRWYGLQHAAAVQALSQEIEAEVESVGTDPSRIVRIANGIDLNVFGPSGLDERREARDRLDLPHDKLIVLFIGRFVTYKGLDDLLTAWKGLSLPSAALVLVGEPGDTVLDRPIAPVQSSDTVIVRGWTTEVKSYLDAGDVYVHPTHGDGMSNALLEAMACGLPIVATRLGSTASLLENEGNALLVSPRSPAQLGSAIRRVATDARLRKALGASAMATARQFDIRTIVARIETVYQQTLSCDR